MTQDNISNSIAQQMELLATLGMELPTTLGELVGASTKALLSGGKLILVGDSESQHCELLLSQLLTHGETIERPSLPVISIRNCAALQGELKLDNLSHVYHSNDLVLILSREPITLNLEQIPKQYNCYGIHCVKQANNPMPQLILGVRNRTQWHIALTLTCNLLVQSIEHLLFGLNNYE